MHKKYNKFLVISFVGVFILGVYSYFYNGFVNEVSSADSSLTSSLAANTPVSATADLSQQASADTAFLLDLATLNKIKKIDATIFSEPAFTKLVDNKIPLEESPYGRVNPFSPTDKPVNTNKPVVTVTTNLPSSITNRSAVLNGTLEGGATSTNIYFEYGIAENLGKLTPKTTSSLVGNFASVLSGLTSKTTYFYRAAANINGNIAYGDLVSFNTN